MKEFKLSVNDIVILSLLFFSFGYFYYHIVNVVGMSLWNVLVVIVVFTVIIRVWIRGKEIK